MQCYLIAGKGANDLPAFCGCRSRDMNESVASHVAVIAFGTKRTFRDPKRTSARISCCSSEIGFSPYGTPWLPCGQA
jgi:hypothetical protein